MSNESDAARVGGPVSSEQRAVRCSCYPDPRDHDDTCTAAPDDTGAAGRALDKVESVRIVLPDGALGGWWVLIDALRQAQRKTGYEMTFGGLIEQIERQTQPVPADDGAVE